MMHQKVKKQNIYQEYVKVLKEKNLSRVFIVAGKASSKNDIIQKFLNDYNTAVIFQDFSPNPTYESVIQGLECFNDNNCDCILAIGGGSAIDVAKCIKAFDSIESLKSNYLDCKIKESSIPLIAIPTTAGAGSEATKFAVIYYQGEKKSIEHESLIPDVVLFESSLLYTLPLKQKKSTVLDALCHGIESYWSKNTTEESRMYANQAIQLVLDNYNKYFENDENACVKMQEAAYMAGKAINITKTTAAHALSYKLTTLYDIPHGQAVAICLKKVWEYTLSLAKSENNTQLLKALKDLASAIRVDNEEQAIVRFSNLLDELDIECKIVTNVSSIELITSAVNIDRLKNHPVVFTKEIIKDIYSHILVYAN